MPKWQHPSHARLRSPRFDAVATRPLTDKRIRHYMLKGFYGPEAQARAEAEGKSRPRPPRADKEDSLTLALAFLNEKARTSKP